MKEHREKFKVIEAWRHTQSILVSICLDLEPEAIIRLYSRRFRIVGCFRKLKQQIDGFGYHFWSQAMPKLNHFSMKGTSVPLSKICDDKLRTAVGAIKTEFERKGTKTEQWHYYISSRNLTAVELLHHARMEWAVETEPFPEKRTRKAEKKQNEPAGFRRPV